jgi:hypothetical protein
MQQPILQSMQQPMQQRIEDTPLLRNQADINANNWKRFINREI